MLFDNWQLKETIIFNGTLDELDTKLNRQTYRNFLVEWISTDKFKFLARESDGTAVVNGNPSIIDGIKGYGLIKIDADDRIEIEVSTYLRPEIKYLIGFSFICSIVAVSSMKLILILLVLVFPFAIIWLFQFYRKQELELFEEVNRYLRNENK